MSTQAWDAYWAEHSTTNSFACDYAETEGPYGAIFSFWREQFAKFSKSDTVLDLAAGNGALVDLYLHVMGKQSLPTWYNLDAANARPVLQHPNIHYQKTTIEALPFADASADHVISMFGFEYSDMRHSLKEALRCLKPAGECVFVMHHPDAVISEQSRITCTTYDQMLADPIWDNTATFSTMSPQQVQRTLLRFLNQHLQQVPQDAQDDVKLIGQSIFNILQSNTHIEDIIAQLQRLEAQMRFQVERLQQQMKAAAHSGSLTDIATELGCVFSLHELSYGDAPLAWVFRAKY